MRLILIAAGLCFLAGIGFAQDQSRQITVGEVQILTNLGNLQNTINSVMEQHAKEVDQLSKRLSEALSKCGEPCKDLQK